MSYQLAMQAALSGFGDDPQFRIYIRRLDGSAFSFELSSPAHRKVGEEFKFPERSFIARFPADPMGLRLWCFLNYDEEKALRWFLSNTLICYDDGASIFFEEPGIKIQTARGIWNLALAAMNGDALEKNDGKSLIASLPSVHRVRKLYDKIYSVEAGSTASN